MILAAVDTPIRKKKRTVRYLIQNKLHRLITKKYILNYIKFVLSDLVIQLVKDIFTLIIPFNTYPLV